MIVLLFLGVILCSWFGIGCEEPEKHSFFEDHVSEGTSISVSVNTTNSKLFDPMKSSITINGTEIWLADLNQTSKFADPLIEEQSRRCELIEGDFIFYYREGKYLCDLSTIQIGD